MRGLGSASVLSAATPSEKKHGQAEQRDDNAAPQVEVDAYRWSVQSSLERETGPRTNTK
jgi:hypothetical protein